MTANTDGDSVSVLLGNGTGNFAVNKDYPTGKGPVAVAAADLNGDGRPDLVSANADANSVSYLQNSAVTAGTFNVAKSLSTGQTPADVALGDVNGDSKLDLIVAIIVLSPAVFVSHLASIAAYAVASSKKPYSLKPLQLFRLGCGRNLHSAREAVAENCRLCCLDGAESATHRTITVQFAPQAHQASLVSSRQLGSSPDP